MGQEKNKEDKEKATLIISASRVKTYTMCPRKYYYNYIEKLPRMDWDHFDLGTLVHGVLEFFHESLRIDADLKKANVKRIMKEAFKKQRQKMEKGDENHPSMILKPKILLEARDLLKEYLDNIISNGIGSTILALEDEFELDLNEEFRIKGVVDRIDQDRDGIFHIKDYKTNKNPKYMESSQLCTYGLYLLNKYPDVKKFRGSYVMMRFGGMPVNYDFTVEDVEKERKKLIEYAELISNEERWIARPSRLCNWCDFQSICLSTW